MNAKYLIGLGAILTVGCAPDVGFEKESTEGKVKEYSIETATKNLKFNDKTDILFVLDESCSMESIINNVRQGVASVNTLDFAPDTKMAVTYMSPAQVDSSGQAIVESPFYPDALHSPGYFNFVSTASVDNFLNLQTPTAKTEYLANEFTKKLCADEWFSPDQVNADSEACLQGAMQAPMMCVGAEAGLTYIKQFSEKLKASSQSLFRDGSNAHIVFVSDTHDAGISDYYGSANNPVAIPSHDDLRKAILDNNPNIQSIRMSGVIPVPIIGDPKLTNLTVVGAIPQNDIEAKVGSENFNDYSYLEAIKASSGIAIHANNSNWQLMMDQLIEFTASTSKVVVQLKNKSEKIESVEINGVKISSTHYSYSASANILTVTHNFANGVNYEIVVLSKYESK